MIIPTLIIQFSSYFYPPIPQLHNSLSCPFYSTPPPRQTYSAPAAPPCSTHSTRWTPPPATTTARTAPPSNSAPPPAGRRPAHRPPHSPYAPHTRPSPTAKSGNFPTVAH